MFLTAALFLSASISQPQVDQNALRAVPLIPVPLSQGLAEFQRICLATDFDGERFSAAVGTSAWRFQTERGVGTPTPEVRRAEAAVVTFHGPPTQESRSFAPGQCNMEFATQEPVGRQEVLAELASLLAKASGSAPPKHEFPGESCFRRTVSNGRIERLCLMQQRPGAHPHQLALSHQLWTAAGETRAGLSPREGARP